ncbi:MAG: hypothetical protein ACOH19_04025 [Rhodoglobus sp.]
MIEWFVTVQFVVGIVAGLACVVVGFAGRAPNDYTIGATALIELLLIVQIVISLAAPAFGNAPTGDPLEFWIYVITAALIPPAAVFWSLIERNRWSTVILGVACLSVAVMVYRMGQIWFVQSA